MPLHRTSSKTLHCKSTQTYIPSIQKLIPDLPESISQLIRSCSNFPAMNPSFHFPLCYCSSSQIWQRELAPAEILPICPLQSITSKPPNACVACPGGSSLPSRRSFIGWTEHDVPLKPKGPIKQWALLPYVSWQSFFFLLGNTNSFYITKTKIYLAGFWLCASFSYNIRVRKVIWIFPNLRLFCMNINFTIFLSGCNHITAQCSWFKLWYCQNSKKIYRQE